MTKFFMGLLVGLLICGAGYFALVPSIKQTAYQSGFDDGNKKGIASGIATGVSQGISEIRAQQEQQRDSVTHATAQKQKAVHRAALMASKKSQKKVIQNWHVIDGKIAEPITE